MSHPIQRTREEEEKFRARRAQAMEELKLHPGWQHLAGHIYSEIERLENLKSIIRSEDDQSQLILTRVRENRTKIKTLESIIATVNVWSRNSKAGDQNGKNNENPA
jgi:hypothetical protein